MDEGKVRTIHYYLGINYVWFLLLQVLPGLFMSLGMLLSATDSRPFWALSFTSSAGLGSRKPDSGPGQS